MLRRRIGRPGLIGTMARTAVIAGTATAVSGGIQRRQQERARDEVYADTVPAAPLASAAAAPAADDTVAQLAKLGELRQSGVLDDAEFAAAKARLLGI